MPSFSRSGYNHGGAGEVQGDNGYGVFQSLCQQDGYLVIFPGVYVDDLPFRKELGNTRGKNAKVGAAVIGGFRTGVTGYPDDFANLELAILGKLAEQPKHAIFEIGEGAIRRAGSPESIEGLFRVSGKIYGCHSSHDTGGGKFGDLLR